MVNKSSKKPVKKVTSRQMVDEFNRITNLLEDIRQSQIEGDKNFNYFFAVGMGTQEIKHSAFLAFLLDPNRLHGLKNEFLRRFLKSLYTYNTPFAKSSITVIPNNKILRDVIFAPAKINPDATDELAYLEKLCEDKNIEVLREVVIDSSGKLLEADLEDEEDKKSKNKKNGDGRMDILIKFNDSKTLVVVENKLYSELHDDQLKKYENGLNSGLFKDYNKIYVYLRIDGSAPLNEDGGYNAKWCVFDYNVIRTIIGDILKGIKEKTIKAAKVTKLCYILEDYMAILDKGNLHGKDGLETRAKIRKFLGNQDNRDLVEMLYYYPIKDDNVFGYIYKWLKTEFSKPEYIGYNYNPKGGEEGRKSFNFTLSGLEAYKSKYNIRKKMVYEISSNSDIGGFLTGFDETLRTEIQSKTNVKIKQSVSLFAEKDRGFIDTNDVAAKADLEAKLAEFLNIVLTADNIIKTL